MPNTCYRAQTCNSGLPLSAGDLSIEVAECGRGGGRQLQAARDIEPGQTLLSMPFPAVFIDQVGLVLRRPYLSLRVFLVITCCAHQPRKGWAPYLCSAHEQAYLVSAVLSALPLSCFTCKGGPYGNRCSGALFLAAETGMIRRSATYMHSCQRHRGTKTWPSCPGARGWPCSSWRCATTAQRAPACLHLALFLGPQLLRVTPCHCYNGKVLGKPVPGIKVLEGGEQARGGRGGTPAVRVGGRAAAAHVAAVRDILARRPGGLRRRMRGAPGLHGVPLPVFSTFSDNLWQWRHGTPACNELPK